MTETRRITFQGSGPLARALVQMLEREGVNVQVRRGERPTAGQPDMRTITEQLSATLLASGTVKGIEKGVRRFRTRFPGAAKVGIEDDRIDTEGPMFQKGRLG